ncbi:cardiolipin synthase, partial [Bacillus sp. D-CC]
MLKDIYIISTFPKPITVAKGIAIIIVFVFGGYSAFNSHFSPAAGEDNNTETVILSKDFPSTSDLNQMIDEADLVVIGEYEGLDSKWN